MMVVVAMVLAMVVASEDFTTAVNFFFDAFFSDRFSIFGTLLAIILLESLLAITDVRFAVVTVLV